MQTQGQLSRYVGLISLITAVSLLGTADAQARKSRRRAANNAKVTRQAAQPIDDGLSASADPASFQLDVAPAQSPGTYAEAIKKGMDLAVAQDHRSALSYFEAARGMEPRNPEAYYFMGETLRMSGDNERALSAFRVTTSLAQASGNFRYEARGLQGIADTLERFPSRLKEARATWENYIKFADMHPDVSYREVGPARIAAIDRWLEQETAYVAVRQRIAKREAQKMGKAESGSVPSETEDEEEQPRKRRKKK